MIRPAQPADVAAIVAMVRELAEYEREPDAVELSEPTLAGALFGPSPLVFADVAVDGGQVVGHALWYVNFSSWTGRHGIWLDDLFVRSAWRGRGHGLALVRALAARCVARGYARLEWAVLDWNEPAIRLYQSLGARSMEEWTINRLEGAALHRVGAGAPQPAGDQPPG